MHGPEQSEREARAARAGFLRWRHAEAVTAAQPPSPPESLRHAATPPTHLQFFMTLGGGDVPAVGTECNLIRAGESIQSQNLLARFRAPNLAYPRILAPIFYDELL